MLKLFISGLARAAGLWFSLWTSPWRDRRSFRATAALLVLWPGFVGLQLLHWVGFLLDELLFRGWRRVDVDQPVFVLGPPRSGTTHLHRVLALDPERTTFSLWECLFGLSVSGKLLCLGVARLHRWLDAPLARVGRWLARRFGPDLDDVHTLALDAPEEDFLVLMPVFRCFILAVVFPNAGCWWGEARLDVEASRDQRRRLMRFYRACVQKHLYVFGRDKRFLSKNASFSGMPESLMEMFPDARILACSRDPVRTVPSQLSALRPGLAVAGFNRVPEALAERLIELLKFYYLHLEAVARRIPERVVMIDNGDLHHRLAPTLSAAWSRLGLTMGPEFERALARADRESRKFRSAHRYRPDEFGLNEDQIRHRFAEVYARRTFNAPARSNSA